jgi:hypothetical protein
MILNSPTISGSLTVTGNIIASGSITLSGSVASASYAATASFVALAQSASNAVSSATASFANAFTVASTLTAQTLVVQTITSSIDYVTGSTRFGSLSSNTHIFTGSLNVTGALYVATGSVGIGTVSPSQLLEVVGGEIKAGRVDSSNEGGQVSFGRSTDNATAWYIDAYGNVASPQLRFVNVTNAVVAMTITGSNVGIGTSSPAYTLEVSANAATWGARVYNASATGNGLVVSTNNTTTNGGLALYNGTSYVLYARNDGNVGIGTSSPTEKLHLYDANYPVIRMSAGAATTDSYYLYANQSARFYITNVSSGNGAYLVYNSSSGWTGVSDARWKTDWSNLEGSLSLINRLNIGKYKMLNNDKEVIENARWDYGIKAQELLDIIPDAVDVPKDENDKYGVIHNIVFYNAIKAIQELSAQVQQLSKQNDALQSRIETLESK